MARILVKELDIPSEIGGLFGADSDWALFLDTDNLDLQIWDRRNSIELARIPRTPMSQSTNSLTGGEDDTDAVTIQSTYVGLDAQDDMTTYRLSSDRREYFLKNVPNLTGNDAEIYPPLGGSIDGLAVDEAFILSEDQSRIIWSEDGVNWNVDILEKVPAAKTAYVDSIQGDDDAGEVGNALRAFQTITAAEAAIASGDSIEVFEGIYSDSDIGSTGKDFNIKFQEGATMITSSGTYFSITAASQKVGIYGKGVFNGTTTQAGGTFLISGVGADVTIEADYIKSANTSIFVVNATANINVRYSESSLNNVLTVRGAANVVAKYDEIVLSGAGAAIFARTAFSGSLDLTVRKATLQSGFASQFVRAEDDTTGDIMVYAGMVEDNCDVSAFPNSTIWIGGANTFSFEGKVSSDINFCFASSIGSASGTGVFKIKGEFESQQRNAVLFRNDVDTLIAEGVYKSPVANGTFVVGAAGVVGLFGSSNANNTAQINGGRIINTEGTGSSYGIRYAEGAGNKLIIAGNLAIDAIDNSILTATAGDDLILIGNVNTNVAADANTSVIGTGAVNVDANVELID